MSRIDRVVGGGGFCYCRYNTEPYGLCIYRDSALPLHGGRYIPCGESGHKFVKHFLVQGFESPKPKQHNPKTLNLNRKTFSGRGYEPDCR